MDSGRRRLRAFGSLAGNRALLRVLAAYLLFILTEYAVWIAMLVFAYKRGGTAIAGLVAVAQLVPAAVVAPVAASLADRRSPVFLLAGGYLVQAAAMAGTAAAVGAGSPLAAYAAAVVAATAVTTTRPAQSALIPSLAATPDQLTGGNVVAGWLEAAGAAAAGCGPGWAWWRRGSWPACGWPVWPGRSRVRRSRPRGPLRACGWRSVSRGCGSCWPC
jgi:MFS family permease